MEIVCVGDDAVNGTVYLNYVYLTHFMIYYNTCVLLTLGYKMLYSKEGHKKEETIRTKETTFCTKETTFCKKKNNRQEGKI